MIAALIRWSVANRFLVLLASAFEPSYVDWLARTITRDPELVAAARSVQADLDQQGVVRRPHPIGENERRAQARDAG